MSEYLNYIQSKAFRYTKYIPASFLLSEQLHYSVFYNKRTHQRTQYN